MRVTNQAWVIPLYPAVCGSCLRGSRSKICTQDMMVTISPGRRKENCGGLTQDQRREKTTRQPKQDAALEPSLITASHCRPTVTPDFLAPRRPGWGGGGCEMRCDQASEKEASAIPALWDTPECVGHPFVHKGTTLSLGMGKRKGLGHRIPTSQSRTVGVPPVMLLRGQPRRLWV